MTSTIATAAITVNAPAAANSPLTIPVAVNIAAVPVITSVSPNPIPKVSQDTAITLTGSGYQNGVSVRVNNTTVPTQFVNATTLQATIPGALLSNAPSLQLVVFNADGSQSAAFPLPLRAAGPAVAATGIVNAASGLPGAVAPGEIISVTGTGFGTPQMVSGEFTDGLLPTQLAETRLLVDGVAAPLLYVGANQLGAIVPYSVNGRPSVTFEVEYRGQRSAPAAQVSIVAASPASVHAELDGPRRSVSIEPGRLVELR